MSVGKDVYFHDEVEPQLCTREKLMKKPDKCKLEWLVMLVKTRVKMFNFLVLNTTWSVLMWLVH